MSIKLMMPSNHLILCHLLLLLPSIFLSIRVFSNELVFHIRWPKFWSMNERMRNKRLRACFIIYKIRILIMAPCVFEGLNVIKSLHSF